MIIGLLDNMVTACVFSAAPSKVAVDVSEYLHEVRMDGGEADAGRLPHVDGALLCQVHVVEVDELKLGLLLRPDRDRGTKTEQHFEY